MKHQKSLESSINLKIIGPNKVLSYLRTDIQKAQNSIFIVGPWIDQYFIEQITNIMDACVDVRVLVRMAKSDDDIANDATFMALRRISEISSNLEIRSISSLHAKAIIIDDKILYFGSTNWYRYSLEKSLEITIRGDLSEFNGVMRLINEYWNEATIVNLKDIGCVSKVTEINQEIMDPFARQALEGNPKAFILTKKKKK